MSLSSLLNTAPCLTGAADPRRATVARVLVDTVPALTRCGLSQQGAQLVWDPQKLTGTHNSAGKWHSSADESQLKYARSWHSTDWTWIACALFGVDWSKTRCNWTCSRTCSGGSGRRFDLGQQCRGGQQRRKYVGQSLCGVWARHLFGLEQARRTAVPNTSREVLVRFLVGTSG